MITNVDALVASLAKELRKNGSAVLIAYSALDDNGKPTLRVVSNSDAAGTEACWNFLTKIDDRGVEAGAKALFQAGMSDVPDEEKLEWDDLQPEDQTEFFIQARAVLNAAKAHQGKTLNAVQIASS